MRRLSGLVLLVPAVLAWALCFWGIGTSQLWQDEGATWWATQLRSEDLGRLLRNVDAVLAPYYFGMRIWTSMFGDSETALRWPSALAMGLCASVVAALGKRMLDASLGLRAGLAFALIPLVSRYGQEARPYAFVSLFAALSTLLFLRLLDAPGRARMLAYGASIVALGLSHLVALSLLAAHAVACLRFARRPPRIQIAWGSAKAFMIVATISVGLLSPLFVLAASQSGQINSIALPSTNAQNLARPLGSDLWFVQLVLAVLLVFAWLTPRAPGWLRAWSLFPFFLLVVTHPLLHLFRLRYLVFTLPAWALLIAISLDSERLRANRRSWVTAVMVLVIGALGAKTQVKQRSSHARSSSDYRSAATIIKREAQPNDAIAFGGSDGKLRHGRLALAYELRNGPHLPDIFSQQSMADVGRFSARECDHPRACLPAEVRRVWLVTTAPRSLPFAGMPAERSSLFAQDFVVSRVTDHWHGQLLLLSRK